MQLDLYLKRLLTLSESSPPHQLRNARIFSVESRITSADANLKLNTGTCRVNSDTCNLRIFACADTCAVNSNACRHICKLRSVGVKPLML
jgi:hypothetical protein